MRDLASPSAFAFAGLSPELLVSDLARSLEFWRDLCGFRIAYERAEERFAYLDRGGLQVMLEELGSPMHTWMKCDLESPFGRGVNFQFRIGDVDRGEICRGRLAVAPAARGPALSRRRSRSQSTAIRGARSGRLCRSIFAGHRRVGRGLRPRSRIAVLILPWRGRIRFERGGGGRRSRA